MTEHRVDGVRVVDLSHPVTAGMVTFPGLPGPLIAPHLTREQTRPHYEAGAEFLIDPDGTDVGQQPLELLVDLPTVVVHAVGSRSVDVAVPGGTEVGGHAVLVHTGWDRHWSTPAYGAPDAPFLSAAAADRLVEAGALLVGIDSVNIDHLADRTRPVHSILLAAGVPILENLTNLGALPATGARLHAAPPALHGMGAMTVRAYALVRA
jgi:arylformamidase